MFGKTFSLMALASCSSSGVKPCPLLLVASCWLLVTGLGSETSVCRGFASTGMAVGAGDIATGGGSLSDAIFTLAAFAARASTSFFASSRGNSTPPIFSARVSRVMVSSSLRTPRTRDSSISRMRCSRCAGTFTGCSCKNSVTRSSGLAALTTIRLTS